MEHFLLKISVLTISVDVHSTGISLAIVVCVCLVWVTVVGAVITAVAHVIAVIIILPGVEDEWTVVLFQRGRERGERFEVNALTGSIYSGGGGGGQSAG